MSPRRNGVKVIEVSDEQWRKLEGRRTGSIGDVGCFSLQFNKILTSGEGGMVITNDEDVWKRAVMFHDVIGGMRNNFTWDETLWGINFRMPELLGAVMLVQLRRLGRAAGGDARAQDTCSKPGWSRWRGSGA